MTHLKLQTIKVYVCTQMLFAGLHENHVRATGLQVVSHPKLKCDSDSSYIKLSCSVYFYNSTFMIVH